MSAPPIGNMQRFGNALGVTAKTLKFTNTTNYAFMLVISSDENSTKVMNVNTSAGGSGARFQMQRERRTVNNQKFIVNARSKADVSIPTTSVFVTLARKSSDGRSWAISYEGRQFQAGQSVEIADRHVSNQIKRVPLDSF